MHAGDVHVVTMTIILPDNIMFSKHRSEYAVENGRTSDFDGVLRSWTNGYSTYKRFHKSRYDYDNKHASHARSPTPIL